MCHLAVDLKERRQLKLAPFQVRRVRLEQDETFASAKHSELTISIQQAGIPVARFEFEDSLSLQLGQ